jgi:hypothetical protein
MSPQTTTIVLVGVSVIAVGAIVALIVNRSDAPVMSTGGGGKKGGLLGGLLPGFLSDIF